VEEELERDRQGHQETLRRAERLEREQTDVSEVQQEAEQLRQERQQLAEDAERENAGLRSYAAQQEQEVARLEQELQRSQEALDGEKRAEPPAGTPDLPRVAVVAQTRPDGRSALVGLDRMVYVPGGCLEHACVMSPTRTFGRRPRVGVPVFLHTRLTAWRCGAERYHATLSGRIVG
jgi:multidrug efflux pump subunit AcrA (membrane-fusion protein)